ncbi:hypothetical protein PISMIDRAFT_89311 [Pisolithus microcarpus 441]|uniref:Complex 1 LYR protein domain-containing protein n=1 Tax=Pisolithus microcarpus 441 TaxID=765257 RepID=A0A0C9ZU23_9AGAM|nr:hypothetical protein BKA83DRAFT_89311 [Pisolithus microcarpus]KIK29429.1 hypothetical protein PISMIDRAFT_89311 [Pisolithus microcarpus 441]
MVNSPSRQQILRLYGSTLRAARSFSSYNFRNYFVRRTRENFRNMQTEQDSGKLSYAYGEAVKELAVLRRSAMVNQLYGGWRLVVENQSEVRERGEN